MNVIYITDFLSIFLSHLINISLTSKKLRLYSFLEVKRLSHLEFSAQDPYDFAYSGHDSKKNGIVYCLGSIGLKLTLYNSTNTCSLQSMKEQINMINKCQAMAMSVDYGQHFCWDSDSIQPIQFESLAVG